MSDTSPASASPQTNGDARPAAIVLRFALLAGLAVGTFVLGEFSLHYPSLVSERAHLMAPLMALLFVTALVSTFAPDRFRRPAMLAVAAGAWATLLGWPALLVVLAAAVAVALGRAPGPLPIRAAAWMVLWAIAPAARHLVGVGPSGLAFGLTWAALAYNGLFLIVQRTRRKRALLTGPLDEAYYLLAIPRVVTPFIQPIPPSHIFARETRHLSPRRSLAAFVLGAAGAGLGVLMATWHHVETSGLPPATGTFQTYAYEYAANAGWLFSAVALFRFIGFDIGSGFRWHLVSRSFADMFRRWNTYIRDLVLQVYLWPLARLLQRFLPRPVATLLAGYLAIVLGAFVLLNVIIPVCTLDTANLRPGFTFIWRAERIALYFVWYTAILIPQLGVFTRWRRWEEKRPWLQHGLFICGFFGILTLMYLWGVKTL